MIFYVNLTLYLIQRHFSKGVLMTHRERLLKVINGGIPDYVPVAPDFSNMIPAKLTGKPFWDIYLYNNPPSFEAYIDCAKFFDIDAVMDGYFPFLMPDAKNQMEDWTPYIVEKRPDKIVTQYARKESGKLVWQPVVHVYYIDNPPTYNVPPTKVGLPDIPKNFEPVEGIKPVDRSVTGLKRALSLLGDQGLFGLWLTNSTPISNEQGIYWYYDHPEEHEKRASQRVQDVEELFRKFMALDVRPDFFCVGGSGTLVFQTLEMFRTIAFPAVKRAVELATSVGIPTHIHSCGQETELVKIMAEETDLTIIDPLEIPPMGDCNLKDLKKKYGSKLTLKGNLHTTDVMLRGTVEDVARASKQAIDDAAEGGRFILSTGDQCGRDTPFENLRTMVQIAREYGRY
jgi:hypothetical protein